MKLKELNWQEVKEARGKPAVVPVGSIEQHGPHLPLATDILIAKAVAKTIAKEIGGILTPPQPYGISPEHLDFPGTISLGKETFIGIIEDMVSSFSAGGFEKVVVVNGHGGNSKTLRQMQIEHVYVLDVVSTMEPYDHAGDIETSLMLHLHPDLVRKDKITKCEFRWPDRDGWKTKDCSESGVFGDPTTASAKKGKGYFDRIVATLLQELKELEKREAGKKP